MIEPCKGLAWEEPFSGFNFSFMKSPRVVAALQPWAEVSQRLRRLMETKHEGKFSLRSDLTELLGILFEIEG